MVTKTVHRRQPRGERQVVDANLMGGYKRIATDIKGIRSLKCLEGGRDIVHSPDLKSDDLEAASTGHCLNLAHLENSARIADTGHYRQPPKTGENFVQEFVSLGSK